MGGSLTTCLIGEERLSNRIRSGDASVLEREIFCDHMLTVVARMGIQDAMVMQIHAVPMETKTMNPHAIWPTVL